MLKRLTEWKENAPQATKDNCIAFTLWGAGLVGLIALQESGAFQDAMKCEEHGLKKSVKQTEAPALK